MTGPDKIEADKIEADRIGPDSVGPDKMESHYRQQLSALMDGALPPDEARFLLRRLQHDDELAQCVDRWHVAGDVLRGEAPAILPAGFAERVAEAIANEPGVLTATPAAARNVRWGNGLRWGSGAALAASVALVALFVARQPSGPRVSETPSSVVSQIGEPSITPSNALAGEPVAAPIATVAPAAVLATASIASVPRRNTIRPSTRSQSQRATIRTPARAAERPMVAASQGDVSSAMDIFGNTPAAPSRPWPSAVVPQTSSTGSFTVDYGSASSPSFYPFEPRLPEAQTARGEATPTSEDATPP